MSTQPRSVCPSCGQPFSGTLGFCPVCLLREVLASGEADSGEPSSEDTPQAPPDRRAPRFEHYELLPGEDGKPVELGRGAMGVTYKAFDVDLHCPVTLKVISERFLCEESARLRFLREARAAASVRHPNVASVFHLGRTGQNYFYAMEFVEGETLENLIKRSGRLEVKLALEIATQVAAGLAAVHKQKLVHRDIKPSNIMVSAEEGSTIAAKIIDLGLAKPAPDSPVEAAISIFGAFAGTPEFASPEQFACVGVDIRSDLYSLGVVLWEMMTGHAVFRGSPAEVMYKQQHTPLPLEELEHVPQPVVVLLAHDIRQGAHARKVMESYQSWFGEGPELPVLRLLGLFDRPADEKALEALLKSPAIPGLTELLTDLHQTAWRTILARLRRARLLAGEDPQNPGQLDTHPLVREYFGEQLRSQRTEAWKKYNRRLYEYYQTLVPQLPNSFREMEPLFSAVISGCNAGLFREVLHEVYIPRIQRGNASFAANVLGATGPLLSVLVHFFEHGNWGSPVETAVKEQSLTAEDQLFILMQAAKYLSATRGLGAPQARICYERAESLCHSLNNPRLLCLALRGQWRYSLMTDKLRATMQIAERVYALAQEQNDAALMLGAYSGLACTLYFLGDFESTRQYARHGVQIWRSGGVQSYAEDVDTPVVGCLCHGAHSEWHLGEIASCRTAMAEAISLAKELKDMSTLALALNWAASLGYAERNPAEVDRLASQLIELSTRHNFVYWLALGAIHRGWALSASGDTAEGITWIEHGIIDFRATGSVLALPGYLARKAEALHLGNRTSEALVAMNEAEALAERFEQRYCLAELHRLRGVFLAAIGADESEIEASLCEAIRIARQQKSISLAKRAEATYTEYRRRNASASGGRGFRLALW